MTPQKFYENYSSNGFMFSKSLLTRYCLSLYTKPFVILSGISGTGKTKIAQLFSADPEEIETAQQAIGGIAENLGTGFIIFNITDGVVNGDGRGNFRFSDLSAIFEADEIAEIKRQISIKEGVDEGNIIDPIELIIVLPDNTELIVGAYLQRASSPLLRVRFKSRRGEAPQYNSMSVIAQNYNVGDSLRLEKVGPHRLKVVSVNDQMVQSAIETIQQNEPSLLNNMLFVAVKSNWTDSSDIFGHYNVLSEKYELTDTLKFLMTANEHPEHPFFLILDEMNLSKVEHYFSDFLSCLESRYIQNGELKQEAIALHSSSAEVYSNDDYFDIVPGRITLPKNLYVTGTVNIDETTYMFSPKVLDRANVIEFNEVDINNYLSPATDTDEKFVLTSFPDFGNVTIANRQAFIDAPTEFKEITRKLIEVLQSYNLHFGYRVINEMALFINNAVSYVGNQVDVIHYAVDVQVSQKVLPKLSGAYGKLEEPLRKLIGILTDNNADTLNLEIIRTLDVSRTSFPLSLAKLKSMYVSLLANGFTSYLE